MMDLHELRCALRVKHSSTLAELTNDCLEGVLVVFLLISQVLGSAYQAQVMVARQDEHIFGSVAALGTADIILFLA